MLSVFITPWMKPTSIQRAMSDACASTTPRSSARYGFSASRRRDGGGRWRGRRAAAGAPASPRRAAYWKVPTRMWLAATRVSTAPGSNVSRATALAGRHHGERAASSGCRARASPRRSRTRAASGRRRPCRRRRARTACGPSPSGAGRAGARGRRPPRRAAGRGRRRAAASSRRTGGRRRPAPPATRPRASRCRRAPPRRPGAGARRVDAELARPGLVEREQPRLGRGRGLPGLVQPLELADERVVERKRSGRRRSCPSEASAALTPQRQRDDDLRGPRRGPRPVRAHQARDAGRGRAWRACARRRARSRRRRRCASAPVERAQHARRPRAKTAIPSPRLASINGAASPRDPALVLGLVARPLRPRATSANSG